MNGKAILQQRILNGDNCFICNSKLEDRCLVIEGRKCCLKHKLNGGTIQGTRDPVGYRIKQAAIQCSCSGETKLFLGRRHGEIGVKMVTDHDHDIPVGKSTKCIPGFVTYDGEFLNRQEAAERAYRAGQLTKRRQRLISDDLW